MDYKEKVMTLLNSKELTKEQKEKLEGIFPELKEESDDEIIYNEILDCFKSMKAYKWISWLERHIKLTT